MRARNRKRRKRRKLCGALLDRSDAAFDRVRTRAIARGQDPEAALRTRLRHRGTCTRPALPGSDRCQWHGGRSTGPTSEQGKANTAAAMVEGRRRWLAELKARGEPVPFGRKPGGRNRSLEERDQVRRDAQATRARRRAAHQSRIVKRERKQEKRRQERELAAHSVRSELGMPWDADMPAALIDAKVRELRKAEREAQAAQQREARKRREKAKIEAALHPPPPKPVKEPRGIAARIAAVVNADQQRHENARMPAVLARIDEVREARIREAQETAPPPTHNVAQTVPPTQAPPGNFRDQLDTVESADQLRVEINDRKRRLAQFGSLPESTARNLDAELARAGGEAAQLAVLDRWLAGLEPAYAMSETIIAGRDQAAYERAMRPRQEERRLTIKP